MSNLCKDVRHAARGVLTAADPEQKTAAAFDVAQRWRNGELAVPTTGSPGPALAQPARPNKPVLVPPGRVARRRLTTAAGRMALLHAVAHIEFNAIDLAFDLIVRFSGDSIFAGADRADFVNDWIHVGEDEARHFRMISARLIELGGRYGDLPAHDGLWRAAENTADDVAARLAIAPLVLEARGLDVTPAMITRLRATGDETSAQLLEIIYKDEISHVAAGARWFATVCAARGMEPASAFSNYVRTRFNGELKAPFNNAAREAANFPSAWYESAPHNS